MNLMKFQLFITGSSMISQRALANLHSIIESELENECELEVIDVLENPALAEECKVVAAPTLIKRGYGAETRIIGDLSDRGKVLAGLRLNRGSAPAV